MSRTPVKICFCHPAPSAPSTYRCTHHLRAARALGWDAHVVADVTPEALEEYDAFVLSGHVSMNEFQFAEWVKRRGKVLAFDVPEDFLSARCDAPHDPMLAQSLSVERVVLGMADVVTAATSFLAGQARAFAKNIFVVPDLLDERVWTPLMPSRRADLGIPEDAVTIGWSGNEDQVEDVRAIEHVLRGVLDAHPDAHVLTVGIDPELSMLSSARHTNLGIRGMDEYADFLRHIDIAVVPARRALTSKCASGLRALEHGMAGSAVLASRVRPFEELLDAGAPLVLAGTDDEWRSELVRLVDDGDARRASASAMAEHVRENWTLEARKDIHTGPLEAIARLCAEGGRA